MRTIYRFGVAAAFIVFLASCAGYNPNHELIGSSRQRLTEVMGPHSSELSSAAGKVMIYPRGPFGKHTYFVYLNEEGNVERWSQVLNTKNFELIQPGMSRDQVIAIIGESKIRDGLAFGNYLWSWRYVNSNCFWFRVEFSPENIVRSTMYQKPPECRAKK